MEEIVKIALENEMDLILAHKRAMKLSELCGMSLSAQTTFATAVSEISRCAISFGSKSYLVLDIDMEKPNRKELVAVVVSSTDLSKASTEAISYARRLMGDLHKRQHNGLHEIRINQRIPFGGTITVPRIQSFKEYFKHEPPLSPYDEIRKKNIQLIDLSNKLRESENQYRMLSDTLPLMVFALSQKGEVTYANKWMKDFSGISAEMPFSAPWQSMVHPDDYRSMGLEWEKAQVNRTPFRTQGRIRQKDKESYLWHLISIIPVKNEKDAVSNWIGFFVDIHAQKLVEETLKDNKELKQAQVELRKYQLQLEQKISELNISNHDLEQFAYIASHDLQEPLRKIKTFSSLLEGQMKLGEKERNYFQKIIDSADRMSTLIRDVLNYSRLSRPENKMSDTDLNEVLEKVKQDMELLIQEKQANIISDQLPVLEGISLQFYQLFYNLIGNSLKFTEGLPVISISCSRATQEEIEHNTALSDNESYYHIVLKDNGIGFEQKYAQQIFTIFQRLRSSQQSYSGTGIGLALCKKIVNNHKGSISAESEPGKGSTFHVYLPVHQQH